VNPPDETKDMLALRPMPKLAAALRSRMQAIIERWTRAVEEHLPDADPLTSGQVRDSIPKVLEKIALALESARPEMTDVLEEVGTAHGVARFQQHYDIDEMMIEYRLLRRIIFDELNDAAGDQLRFVDAIPVNMGVDTASHRGVTSYVRYLTEQLRANASAESKYLSFLSHDLRNNLNTVTLTLESLSQQLMTSPEHADAVEEIERLRRSVFITIDGMNRLLQAERLRTQAVTLKLGPVDLHRLAAHLLSQVEQTASEKGLRLENAVPPQTAAHSDRDLLTLVLQNLLGNAIKYSSKGVVRLEVHNDPQGWKVAVRDQGPGIAPDKVQQLFNAFTRGETHGQAGMGLGLTIASHAARLLGTELTVESQVGQGTAFSFILACAQPETAA
jgi:signal transduction histidine kinase